MTVSAVKLQIAGNKEEARVIGIQSESSVVTEETNRLENAVTLSDRGSTAHVLSEEVAADLVTVGLAVYVPMEDGQEWIVFGKEDAREKVIGVIKAVGSNPLMTNVKVVQQVGAGLISDQLLTARGIMVVNDDKTLIGMARDQERKWYVVFKGFRDVTAVEGTVQSLWLIDLAEMFKARAPCDEVQQKGGVDQLMDVMEVEDRRDKSNLDDSEKEDLDSQGLDMEEKGYGESSFAMVSGVGRQVVDNMDEGTLCDLGNNGEVIDGARDKYVGVARPTYSKKDERAGRKMLKNWGNGSARSKALTLERGAMRDVPKEITPALLRVIASRNDNPIYSMCKRKIPSQGGSGVGYVLTGQVVSFDDMGQYQASTWGAVYGGLFMDMGSKLVIPYAMTEKSTMIDTLTSYVREMLGWGWKVELARCDAGTTVAGKDFIAAAHALGLRMIPTAPEDQRANPVEAMWGKIIKHDIALLLASQENFTTKDWMLALIRACVNSNTTVHGDAMETPIQQVTGVAPSLLHVTEIGFGQLVTVPRMGTLTVGQTPCELAVEITPVLTGTRAHLVMIVGDTTPKIRANCQVVESASPALTMTQMEALTPTVSPEGDVLEFKTSAKESLTMESLAKRFTNQTQSVVPENDDHLGVQSERDRIQGRQLQGGGFSQQTVREAAGRYLRSDAERERQQLLVPRHRVPLQEADQGQQLDDGQERFMEIQQEETDQPSAAAEKMFVPGETEGVYWQGGATQLKGEAAMHGLWGMDDVIEDDKVSYDVLQLDAREIPGMSPSLITPPNTLISNTRSDPVVSPSPAISMYKSLFGVDPDKTEEKWIEFLAGLLNRSPTREEVGGSGLGGEDDQEVARVFYEATGRLPDMEDWEHADQVFVTTGQLLSAEDIAIDKSLPYVSLQPRVSPAVSKQGGVNYASFKAKVKHTIDNPTLSMIKNDPMMQQVWESARREEFDSNFKEGTLCEITKDQAKSMIQLRPMWVFLTKRNKSKKTRLAFDGSVEGSETFHLNTTYAPTLPVDALKYILAYATYHRMRIQGIDWTRAFLRHNSMEHPSHLNHRDLCAYFGPWECGRSEGMWVQLKKVTQGLADAPRLFCNISDELLLRDVKMIRSKGMGMSQVFYRHKVNGGGEENALMAIGKNVDDVLYITSPNEAGDAMGQEILEVCREKGWEFTHQQLGVGNKPFVIHSLEVTPILFQGDRANLITQPGQLDAIQDAFFGPDVDLEKLTDTDLPPHWSLIAAAADPIRVNGTEYMALIGTIAWAGHTLKHSAALSLLQSQGGVKAGPSSLDLEAVRWLAGYTLKVGREGAGLMFYEGPSNASTDKPPPLNCYVDTGLPGHLNGAAQDGCVLYMGNPNELNGAFLAKSNKNTNRLAESVPVNEARAALKGSKESIAYMEMGMEFAGLTPRTDHGAAGVAAPVIHASEQLCDVLKAADDRDDELLRRADDLITSGYPVNPVVVHEDSQVVFNAVKSCNLTKGMSKMKHLAQDLSCQADWDERELIDMCKSATEEMRADALTRAQQGPVQLTRSAIMLCGWQPALRARYLRLTARYRTKEEAPIGRAHDVEEECSVHDMDWEEQEEMTDILDGGESTVFAVRHTEMTPPAQDAKWSDIRPHLQTRSQTDKNFLFMLDSIGLCPGQGLGKHEEGMVIALDGMATARSGRRRRIGMGEQQVSEEVKSESSRMDDDRNSLGAQEEVVHTSSLSLEMQRQFVPATCVPRPPAVDMYGAVGTSQGQSMISTNLSSSRQAIEMQVLAEVTKANTRANASQMVLGELPGSKLEKGATMCDVVEAHIGSSTILQWVAGNAHDKDELDFIYDTQEEVLQQREDRYHNHKLESNPISYLGSGQRQEERGARGDNDRQAESGVCNGAHSRGGGKSHTRKRSSQARDRRRNK